MTFSGTLSAMVLVVAITAGCSSSSNHATGGSTTPTTASTSHSSVGSTSSNWGSVDVGVLVSETGPFAEEEVAGEAALKAVVAWANATGAGKYPTINLKIVDLQSNPANALTDAKQFVESDHVTAIVALDPFVAVAGTYLASTGVPVITQGLGTVTTTFANNIFGSEGNPCCTSATTTTYPEVMKKLGATSVGSFGVAVSQGAVIAAKSFNAGAKAIGMSAPFLDVSVPLGQPNFTPQALSLKQSGANGVWAVLDQATQSNLLQALVQNSVNLKVTMSPTVYDISSVTPANSQYYQNVVGPTNSQLPGTLTSNPRVAQAISILKTYGNYTQPIEDGGGAGYTDTQLLLYGLHLAGPNPTSTGIVNALRNVTNWLGGLNIDSMNFKNPGPYVNVNGQQGLCTYGMRLKGNQFYDATGLICGTVVSGS